MLLVPVLLRPRKFNYKNIFKRRSVRKQKTAKLRYGQYAVQILKPLRLNSKQIFRYKLFLKKAVRKVDKTGRRAWFNIFPYLPLSKKVAGSRMGKGKGKLAGWASDLPSGINILELKNLRSGRATYYCRQIMHKLPVKSRTIYKYTVQVRLVAGSIGTVRYEAFW